MIDLQRSIESRLKRLEESLENAHPTRLTKLENSVGQIDQKIKETNDRMVRLHKGLTEQNLRTDDAECSDESQTSQEFSTKSETENSISSASTTSNPKGIDVVSTTIESMDSLSVRSLELPLFQPEIVLEESCRNSPEKPRRNACRACRKDPVIELDLPKHFLLDDTEPEKLQSGDGVDLGNRDQVDLQNPDQIDLHNREQIALQIPSSPLHKKRKKSTEDHICIHCLKKFSSKSNLTTHLKLHSDLRPFACPTCPRTFRKKETLENHTIKHTKETPFRCGTCSKTFTRKGILVNHMKLHSSVRPHKCPVRRCQHVAVNNSNLKAHLRIVHGIHRKLERRGVDNELICFKCDAAVDNSEDLIKHFIKRHKMYLASGMRIVKATIATKDAALQTYAVSNGGEIQEYSCNICSHIETKWTDFIAHVREHKAEIERKNIENDELIGCRWCDKVFLLKEGLFQHVVRVHAWGKTFQCKMCDQSFYSKGAFHSHRKMKHVSGMDSDYCDEDEGSEVDL